MPSLNHAAKRFLLSGQERQRAKIAMKIHVIDDYTVLSMNCSYCNISTGANISTPMLALLHGGHLEQVTVSLLTPSQGPTQSVVRIRLSPRPTPLTGATWIQANGRETTVYPATRATGFSQEKIARLVRQPFGAFSDRDTNRKELLVMSPQSQNRKEVQKAIGDRIRYLRTRKGWPSQKALADACGMNHGHMGQIERGQVDVCLGTVARIAKTLNITVSELFEDIS